jgi:hypothetical protein
MRITDETRLPATFATAVALQLAVLLSGTYVEAASKRDALEGRIAQALSAAARRDARLASAATWSGSSGDDWASGAVW